MCVCAMMVVGVYKVYILYKMPIAISIDHLWH